MKDKIFGTELASNFAPKDVFEEASKKAQDIQGLYKIFGKNKCPFFILNTCQRLSLFTVGSCPAKSIRFFEEVGIKKDFLKTYKADDAVEHLFSISSGLQSAHIGESEILHQIKSTLREAHQNKSLDSVLQRLLQKAIEVGKKVRSYTTLMNNSESYPSIVHKLLLKHFEDIGGKKILVIGNGKLGNSCINFFLNRNCDITLATRNLEQVGSLLNNKIKIIHRENIYKNLASFDVIIGAAALVDPLLKKCDILNLKRKPVLIDLGAPQNFSPKIEKLENVSMYSLTDVFEISKKVRQKKSQAIKEAKQIIDLEKSDFSTWLKGRKAAEIIHTLKEKMEQIKSEEQSRLLSDLGEMDERLQKVIGKLVDRLTSRIAHTHYSHIKDFVVYDQS